VSSARRGGQALRPPVNACSQANGGLPVPVIAQGSAVANILVDVAWLDYTTMTLALQQQWLQQYGDYHYRELVDRRTIGSWRRLVEP